MVRDWEGNGVATTPVLVWRNYELNLLCISANQFGYHYVGEMGGGGQNCDLHATQTFVIAVEAS